MFSSIASYIWGNEEEEEEVSVSSVEAFAQEHQVEVDNEWILIPSKDLNDKTSRPDNCMSTSPDRTVKLASPTKDTALITTAQCPNGEVTNSNELSPTEPILMKHGVLSVQQVNEERQNGEERIFEVAKQEPQKPVGRRQMLQKRQPLKDLNDKIAITRKNDSPNNLKRNNMVHTRNHSTRKNKQYGRMESKHVGMVGKRAK